MTGSPPAAWSARSPSFATLAGLDSMGDQTSGSFLVHDGVIQWIGLPIQRDGPREQWAERFLDVQASKEAFLKEIADPEAADPERKLASDAINAATAMHTDIRGG